MSRAPALTMRDVHFAYAPGSPVLRGVELSVGAGELLVLIGANGSGKSTLLRLAAGLARPDRGSVSIAGGQAAEAASRQGRIGYIPQQLGLVRSATALENAVLGAAAGASTIGALLGLVPAAARDRAEAALDELGLSAKRDVAVRNLSGGERQRVAIARTLVQDPRVVVADELLSSLDAHHTETVAQIQRVLRERGVAVLASLHDLERALSLADRIAVLRNGQIAGPVVANDFSLKEARCLLAC